MVAVLIGSQAISHHFKDFREPKDWDFLASWVADGFEKRDDEDWFIDPRLGAWPWQGTLATPDELYTIKISHMFWEVNGSTQNWNKHAYDAIFLSRKGCQFIPELYEILYPIWKELHGGRKAKLRAASKSGFFKDAVVRKYDHDSLHRSVALADDGVPMYEKILKDGSEVDCSWAKFDALPHEDKIILCKEEVFVTALERILIPAWDQGQRADARRAYHWALRRTITSLFTGKWALFMALHLDELLVPRVDYVSWHRANEQKLILLPVSS